MHVLLWSRSTSLGHLRVTRSRVAPVTSSMVSAIASPQIRESQPQSSAGRSAGTRTDIATAVPGMSCQRRSNLPRPESWWLATSIRGRVPPTLTNSAMSVFVDSVESMHVTPPDPGRVNMVSGARAVMARASGKAVAGTYQGYARHQEHEHHSRSDGAQPRSLAKAMRERPALLQSAWQSCTEPLHLPRTAASPPFTNTCATRQ